MSLPAPLEQQLDSPMAEQLDWLAFATRRRVRYFNLRRKRHIFRSRLCVDFAHGLYSQRFWCERGKTISHDSFSLTISCSTNCNSRFYHYLNNIHHVGLKHERLSCYKHITETTEWSCNRPGETALPCRALLWTSRAASWSRCGSDLSAERWTGDRTGGAGWSSPPPGCREAGAESEPVYPTRASSQSP